MFRSTKGQVLIEFLIFIAVSVAVFVGISTITSSLIDTVKQTSASDTLIEFARSIQEEFTTAQGMEEGYSRTIYFPLKLSESSYTLTIISSVLTVSQGNLAAMVTLPPLNKNVTTAVTNITIQKTKSGVII